ncbi:MAG: FAD:protein FMN transferase [Halobacteria archaeon]|nr:FAD:protein FMN transferase [Halobacteria archaeon]
MSISATSLGLRSKLGKSEEVFDCCDTEFRLRAKGLRASRAVSDARGKAETLESELDAFNETSAVSRLNSDGWVESYHVRRVVERGMEYYRLTDGVLDIRHGEVERQIKSYIRGERSEVDVGSLDGVEGDIEEDIRIEDDEVRVSRDIKLDLNSLAKGYIVDAVLEELDRLGVEGFVDGGGDIATTYPIRVGIESPYPSEKPLKKIKTDWSIATSGGYRRERSEIDHIYRPLSDGERTHDIEVGSKNRSVTVVSERDCTEADALATAVSVLDPDEAIELIEEREGTEALVVHSGVLKKTSGFEEHEAET